MAKSLITFTVPRTWTIEARRLPGRNMPNVARAPGDRIGLRRGIRWEPSLASPARMRKAAEAAARERKKLAEEFCPAKMTRNPCLPWSGRRRKN